MYKIKVVPFGSEEAIILKSTETPLNKSIKKALVVLLSSDMAVVIHPKRAKLLFFRQWGETYNLTMIMSGASAGHTGEEGIFEKDDYTLWDIHVRNGDMGSAGLSGKQFQELLRSLRQLHGSPAEFNIRIPTPADGSTSG
jgi:hypothetical protein